MGFAKMIADTVAQTLAKTRVATTLAKALAVTGVLVVVSVVPGCAGTGGGPAGAMPPSADASPAPTSVSPTSAASGSAAASATSPRAADVALSLTADGRLRLQVVSVAADGTPLPASLRLRVGRSAKMGTGVLVERGPAVTHRLLLPGVVRSGGVYYYNVVLRTAAGAARYPATGRYRFVAPVSAGRPLTFLAWGDSRPDTTSPDAPTPLAFRQIVSRALTHRPAVAVASGDLVNVAGGGSTTSVDTKYRHFLAVENRLANRSPVMPSTGNHEGIDDTAGLAGWAKWYALPTAADRFGRYYSFTDGDVHFIVLSTSGFLGQGRLGYYSATSPQNSAQARWLVSDLTRSTARWTVVVLHHPLFDPKPDDYWATDGKTERDALARLFASNGVDLVLEGHSHFYRRHEQPVSSGGRTYRMAYVTEGAGGAPLYPVSSVPLDAYDKVAYSADGYVILRSSGTGTLTAVAYKVDAAAGTETVGDSFAVQQIPRGAAPVP
jgi:hypothetical protein